jgi:hypothetical protein
MASQKFLLSEALPKNAFVKPHPTHQKFGNKCKILVEPTLISERKVHEHNVTFLQVYIKFYSAHAQFYVIYNFINFQALLNHRANACSF